MGVPPVYNSSEKVLRVLAGIGNNLKTARIRRELTLQEAAEKIGTSKSSVMRMEKGDISVKIGVFISAAEVYQALDTISFLVPEHDIIGLSLEKQKQPKRIRKKKTDKLDF